MVITKRVKLYFPDKEVWSLFEDRLDKATQCINYWVNVMRLKESTKLRDLQGKPYFEARGIFKLDSLTTQLCKYFAIRMVRTSKKRRVDAPYLHKKILPIRNIKIDKSRLGLLVGDRKRYWIEFKGEKLISGIIKESLIKKKGDEWFCHLSIKINTPKEKDYKRCLGVDLGIAKTAVVADWNGNNTRFFKGEPYRFKKKHYRDLRTKLQPKLKQGNVYKLLKRIRNKEANWVQNENHRISKEIVGMAVKNKRSIALEKLTGITGRVKVNRKTRKMLKGWSFSQLDKFIEYKAKMAGIKVFYVDPRETSKTCPKCRYSSRSNRRTQALFRCQKCGYESNADRVGAMNIALRGTELLASQ
jgi:IS605 OrfB family transposase